MGRESLSPVTLADPAEEAPLFRISRRSHGSGGSTAGRSASGT
jgi:hypothetical protein